MTQDVRYLNGEYLEFYPDWHESWSEWKADHIEKLLKENGVGPDSVCEVGCGSGGVLEVLSSKYTNVQFRGYDISPIASSIAEKKTSNNLIFHNGSPFEEGAQYDLAMAIDVFEHVEDYYGFLREMRKISKRQIYHIPLDLTVQALLVGNSMMAARKVSGHLHYFYKDTALATLQDTGHKIVGWHYTCGAVDRPGESLKRRLAAVPRRLMFGVSEDWTARVLGGFSMMVLCE